MTQVALDIEAVRTCKECQTSKELKSFPRNGQYRRHTCKSCSNKRRAFFHKTRYRNKQAEWERQRKYGITQEQYEQLKEKHPVCAICEADTKLSVDHCHTTGTVRGLLCVSCNTALGKFKDDTIRIRKAIEYLESSAGYRSERAGPDSSVLHCNS